MTSLHETAYPRFKPDLTPRELEEIYRPTDNEMRLARRLAKSGPARLYLLILLKTTQRLGYFTMLADVPPPIITYLVKCIGLRSVAHRDLVEEEKSQSRRRFIDAIRKHLNISPVTADTERAIREAAMEAAQTKQELADIVNVVIEELIRQRFELPAFSSLVRAAQRARHVTNEGFYRSLAAPLAPSVTENFDAMLALQAGDVLSGWQLLKREPKKPTNNEVRA